MTYAPLDPSEGVTQLGSHGTSKYLSPDQFMSMRRIKQVQAVDSPEYESGEKPGTVADLIPTKMHQVEEGRGDTSDYGALRQTMQSEGPSQDSAESDHWSDLHSSVSEPSYHNPALTWMHGGGVGQAQGLNTALHPEPSGQLNPQQFSIQARPPGQKTLPHMPQHFVGGGPTAGAVQADTSAPHGRWPGGGKILTGDLE